MGIPPLAGCLFKRQHDKLDSQLPEGCSMKYTLAILFLCVSLVAAADSAVFTPEAVLPAGVDESIVINPYTGASGKARKGTVAATINNIVLLNRLLLQPTSEANTKIIAEATHEINALIPSLYVIGVFDLFSADEWLKAHEAQPGRALTAVLYLKQNPAQMNASTKKILDEVYSKTHVEILKSNINGMK